MDEGELELLLALDGVVYELAAGIIVEFTTRQTDVTPERPHGIRYSFVLRRKDGGLPWLRFDNAHAVEEPGRRYRRRRIAHDHWHRTSTDKGRPYNFTTAAQLLDDIWREVKRTLDENAIPTDL